MRGHGEVPAYAPAEGHVWVQGHIAEGFVSMSVAHITTKVRCRYPDSGLLPGTVLLTAKGCAELVLSLTAAIKRVGPAPSLCSTIELAVERGEERQVRGSRV